MDLLPEDVLARVLRRLPPCGLAVSRGVSREWRAVVDARCDLRTDHLPTTLGGIFVKILDPGEHPEFLARPSMERRIAGRLDHYEGLVCHEYIVDCYNGLLLLDQYDQVVVNQATRQWATLPPYPASASPTGPGYRPKYLAFDPTLSHSRCYEVLAIQDPFRFRDKLLSEGSEWPPSVYMVGVYSSSTTRWEERPCAREEGSATTIVYFGSGDWHAAYLNRALYTYWEGDFIMRITLFNDKYKIITLPPGTNGRSKYDKVYLGKSKNRIHFALVVEDDQLRLQVWFLNESGGKTEWILKHSANLLQMSYVPKHDHGTGTDRPWILQYYDKHYHENNKEPEPAGDNGLDWNSDEDNALDIVDDDDTGREKLCYSPYINDVFGFHPYKEILFLHLSDSSVVAYYFNASKIQYLGDFYFGKFCHTIEKAFTYTPCWNREVLAENI